MFAAKGPVQLRAETTFKLIYTFLGWISIGNGLWMLLFASNWFVNIPAGVQDTGPLNAHFVHDVGLAYLVWTPCPDGIFNRPL